ncbi:unnamed protein product [Bursaphelenchus okinawaensis]|uniref:DNA polymerase epsilon catalytic subunit n=1 Tax=Bursaphelenchus okinawaensis TaxID=465554 RepID=A0A811KP22_9BILA|nr:unnamed protein product [Bursaphelenchus okinawaensis]CAG9109561.1 unnamed protein product [Bursaphelenchus okinawaensis]
MEGPERDNDQDDFKSKKVSTDTDYNKRAAKISKRDAIDAQFGYVKLKDDIKRDAWLVNVQPSEMIDSLDYRILACIDLYFIEEDGERFKVSYPYYPYLLLETLEEYSVIVSSYLTKHYEYCWIENVEKVNLDMDNHLTGSKTKYLKVIFLSEAEMQQFKNSLLKTILKNKEKAKSNTDYTKLLQKHFGTAKSDIPDTLDLIIDIREYDLPYQMRVCVDNKIFAGLWYTVECLNPETQKPSVVRNFDKVEPLEPVICAYDIETTKAPLKFPDAEVDQVMMISYMINGTGYLIINRKCVSADIDDFEYTPRPEFQGHFTVYNMPDERTTLQKFFEHLLEVKPAIMVTYNGDFFDWPFVDKRAEHHDLYLSDLGFFKDDQDEYKHPSVAHMDAFRWVKRDSYLPMGSQNLKAATRAKLRYDPEEVDPEEMVQMAIDEPQKMANYSVSDAVATYYLYTKYVHPFVFALCTIIPLGPDDVLRKGSGTLCEALLMVEAFHNNIVFPNKHIIKDHTMTLDGFLINSETYVGAKVEALESGVFKADIDVKFRLEVEALEQLKSEVEATMRHAVEGELGVPLTEVTNFEEECGKVKEVLSSLIEHPKRFEPPKIYHLDVGAMYPNIILTNRLQPPAVVTEKQCMNCVYNTNDAKCKREMEWVWRGDLITATKGEYEGLIMQIEQERFGKDQVPFYSLNKEERDKIEKKRIDEFCRRAHGKIHTAREEKRTTRICQRENSFYVDTVRAFRDRRYDYKALLKKAKNQLSELDEKDIAAVKAGQARVVLYESLQLAHKCILNSFYGYVMRKGSRWFSMEMAGIVCYTGVQIITEARKVIEKVGRPLELDTDGIWCLLPSSFPENFCFKTKNGKSLTVSYPGAMLNALVQNLFTNDQYHDLKQDGKYEIKSENSIFFEVDGPYLAMILPASTEEGKKLKKRYAVFNFDESMAELKGFEVKRRGELGIIKEFQTTIFKTFLKGQTLVEIYGNVAKEADYWIDILESQGAELTDGQLFELIAENRSMSRKLEEYGAQKSTSITTAKRLVEFLGEDMVKNAGLACSFVISKYPLGAPVTERTIPLRIFQSKPSIMVHFLRKWCKNHEITENVNVRQLLDWAYYKERFFACIRKIITIPAALQNVPNPLPRVPHPDWLERVRKEKIDSVLQPKINSFFKKAEKPVQKTPTHSQTSRSLKRPLLSSQVRPLDLEPTTPKRSRKAPLDGTPTRSLSRMSTTSHTSTQPVKPSLKKDGFSKWIAYHITKWRRQEKEKRSWKAEDTTKKRGISRLQQMVMNENERLQVHVWHILQVKPTKTPGLFDVFAIINGNRQKFELKVPRTIYLDDAIERIGSKLSGLALPRNRSHKFLYEITLDETEFINLRTDMCESACMRRVRGVYETQVPPFFKALMQMGHTAKIKSLTNATKISLAQISRVEEVPGLDPDEMKIIFFYEMTYRKENVVFLFAPFAKVAQLFITNKNQQIPNLAKVFEEELGALEDDSQLFENTLEIKFSHTQNDSIKAEIGRFVKNLNLQSYDPVLYLVQSTRTPEEFGTNYSFINSSAPQVRLKQDTAQSVFQSIDWTQKIIKNAMQSYLGAYLKLIEKLEISRISGIPICNLTEDWYCQALDVQYAQLLRKENQILWASEAPQPDLGGKIKDQTEDMEHWDNVSFHHLHSDVYNDKAFVNDYIVVELEMGNIAPNAVMQMNAIIEAEGASDVINYGTEVVNMSVMNQFRPRESEINEAAAVTKALNTIRMMALKLIENMKKGDSYADMLFIHLQRWIFDPASLFYDPAIIQMIITLMKKLCLLIVCGVNKNGGRVLHCSFGRLVLSTQHRTIEEATAFVDSLRKTMIQNPLFYAVNLIPYRMSESTVWMDIHNYARVDCAEWDYKAREWKFLEELTPKSTLKMADHFPENGRCMLRNLIGIYMLNVAKFKKTRLSENKFEQKEFINYCGDFLQHISENEWTMEDGETKIASIYSSVNSLYLKRFKLYEELTERTAIGMILKFQNINFNPAIEFVKALTEVFLLDGDIADVVEDIRTKALNNMGVNENAYVADFKPLYQRVILQQVICPNCFYNVDLDITSTNIVNEEGVVMDTKKVTFKCPECPVNFPREVVEVLLMKRLAKINKVFDAQDFVCTRCKTECTNGTNTVCPSCSFVYKPTIPNDDYTSHLQLLLAVSKVFEFRSLEGVVTHAYRLHKLKQPKMD